MHSHNVEALYTILPYLAGSFDGLLNLLLQSVQGRKQQVFTWYISTRINDCVAAGGFHVPLSHRECQLPNKLMFAAGGRS